MTLTRTAPGIYAEQGKFYVVLDEFAESVQPLLKGLSLEEIQAVDLEGLIRQAAFETAGVDFVERIRTRKGVKDA